ncbi:hypothetical protein C5B85_03295 [Pseudoclavibacter sp. AY1F1]|uniref:hypothetical protein n=1 Tax=Pseudoclavibacter sp. AY1F1 TaxID=2080583 RepID=UPI000CE89947|nr:hypothetical protein [Pseudoclavibacter sp. AY1F1]PPF47301.1 hypothetical protein C5B85_03295 [Pseudoclavibacter sp. AY1F1]
MSSTRPAPPAHAKPESKRRRRRSGGNVLLGVFGTALILSGAIVLAMSLLAPTTVERGYGQVKAAVNDVAAEVQLPAVRLGVEGAQAELDECDGSFIEMTSYRNTVGVPAVYAAHNNCGGDIVLNWEVGTQLEVEGLPGTYEVVDVRHTAKHWETTEALIGLQGDFALQSCFYGEDRMQFVGIRPITG